MDRRHAEGVGDVLLAQRKGEGLALDQVALLEAGVKVQDQAGDALEGRALAEIDQTVLEQHELARDRLAEAEGERAVAPHVVDERLAVEQANLEFGQALHREAQAIGPERVERHGLAGQDDG